MLRTAVIEIGTIRPPAPSRRPGRHLVLAPSLRGSHQWEVVAGHALYGKFVRTRRPRVACHLREAQTVEPLELLIENATVPFLTPVEEARALQTVLAETGLSQRQLAEQIATLQPHISKRLMLLTLTSSEQADLEDGRLTLAEAEQIARRRRRATS